MIFRENTSRDFGTGTGETKISSNINEGIKAVLFFKRKDFTRTKSTKAHVSEQKQKRQRFYALKKHLRGKFQYFKRPVYNPVKHL